MMGGSLFLCIILLVLLFEDDGAQLLSIDLLVFRFGDGGGSLFFLGGDEGGAGGNATGGGRATQPGSASVHPFPMAPKIADLAVSSVTQAAESYLRGIAEPIVQ